MGLSLSTLEDDRPAADSAELPKDEAKSGESLQSVGIDARTVQLIRLPMSRIKWLIATYLRYQYPCAIDLEALRGFYFDAERRSSLSEQSELEFTTICTVLQYKDDSFCSVQDVLTAFVLLNEESWEARLSCLFDIYKCPNHLEIGYDDILLVVDVCVRLILKLPLHPLQPAYSAENTNALSDKVKEDSEGSFKPKSENVEKSASAKSLLSSFSKKLSAASSKLLDTQAEEVDGPGVLQKEISQLSQDSSQLILPIDIEMQEQIELDEADSLASQQKLKSEDLRSYTEAFTAAAFTKYEKDLDASLTREEFLKWACLVFPETIDKDAPEEEQPRMQGGIMKDVVPVVIDSQRTLYRAFKQATQIDVLPPFDESEEANEAEEAETGFKNRVGSSFLDIDPDTL